MSSFVVVSEQRSRSCRRLGCHADRLTSGSTGAPVCMAACCLVLLGMAVSCPVLPGADLGLSRVANVYGRFPKRSKSCKCHSSVARVTRHSRRADGLRIFLPSVEIVISAANERGLKRPRPENRASQLGFMKQRVVNVVTDTWLATAGLLGGQILEARFSTFAASHTPLSSASAVSQGFCTSRWTGQLRRKSLLCRVWG